MSEAPARPVLVLRRARLGERAAQRRQVEAARRRRPARGGLRGRLRQNGLRGGRAGRARRARPARGAAAAVQLRPQRLRLGLLRRRAGVGARRVLGGQGSQ